MAVSTRTNRKPKAEIAWPADKVERRSVESLVPYARNARTHSPEQVAQLARSIQEFGWTVPTLVAEDGTIIAGHGRVMAAKKLGIETIPVMVATGWSAKQKQAYVLADNQLALNADWDNDLLKIELADLSEAAFDLGLTGFSDEQIGAITADVLDINAKGGGDESDSGSSLKMLRFGTKKVSLTEDENAKLYLLFDRYVNDTGLQTGFVNWLVSPRMEEGKRSA